MAHTVEVKVPDIGDFKDVAIMGVCKSYWKQHSSDGKTASWRLTLPLSLSWDHRVIDGAAAARFNVFFANVLADLRRVLF